MVWDAVVRRVMSNFQVNVHGLGCFLRWLQCNQNSESTTLCLYRLNYEFVSRMRFVPYRWAYAFGLESKFAFASKEIHNLNCI